MTDLARPVVRSPKRAESWARKAFRLASAALAAATKPPNTVSASANFPTPAPTQQLDAPAISKQRSGKVLVLAQGSAADAGAFFCTMTLLLDGVALTNGPLSGASFFGGGITESLSLMWIVTLPDTAPHVISALFTGFGGDIVIDNGAGPERRAQIVCIEQ